MGMNNTWRGRGLRIAAGVVVLAVVLVAGGADYAMIQAEVAS